VSYRPLAHAGINTQSSFIAAAPGVGNCNLFLRNGGVNVGLGNMAAESNYVNYGRIVGTVPLGSCIFPNANVSGLSGTVQMVLSCTDGIDSWTVTKNFCPDWFCPDAALVWVASYCPKEYCPETEGLHLSVAQTRLCGKEESCAAGDHSHSDGAAATAGPLAALFITIITIVITL